MNDQPNTLPVGTPVSFHADFRQWEGHIDSYTSTGRAVIVTDEGRQFILEPHHLEVIRRLARWITPADEGILAARAEQNNDDSLTELMATIEQNYTEATQPEVLLQAVRDRNETIERYIAEIGQLRGTIHQLRREQKPATTDDEVKPTATETLINIIAQRDAQLADMSRQIAAAAHERDVLRYALRQIMNYTGGRYVDDAEVMKEIAEAALDGETITPRR